MPGRPSQPSVIISLWEPGFWSLFLSPLSTSLRIQLLKLFFWSLSEIRMESEGERWVPPATRLKEVRSPSGLSVTRTGFNLKHAGANEKSQWGGGRQQGKRGHDASGCEQKAASNAQCPEDVPSQSRSCPSQSRSCWDSHGHVESVKVMPSQSRWCWVNQGHVESVKVKD